MKLLILGGTAFLSAATARQAVERGHQVTCLARGTERRPPAGATWVRADRDAGPQAYDQVAGTDWDAVIDIARQPVQLRQALDALAPRTAHWTFVSSVSVYAEDETPGQDETAAVQTGYAGDRYRDPEQYGPAKVACEELCRQAIGDRVHISRAGLIGGPGDTSDRFGWWPARFARTPDDDVLVPADSAMPVQVIDVDDLAGWLLDAAERRLTGILNAVGDRSTFGEVVDTAQQIAGHHGRRVEVDHDFLLEQGVGYWMGPDSLGLWLPPSYRGHGARSNAAAQAAGMTLRSLPEMTERVLDYERDLGLDRQRRTGLTPEREAALLAAWATR